MTDEGPAKETLAKLKSDHLDVAASGVADLHALDRCSRARPPDSTRRLPELAPSTIIDLHDHGVGTPPAAPSFSVTPA